MYERFPDKLCTNFRAGHQMHWVHWKRTLAAEPIPVVLRFMDDEKVGILLAPTRRALTYWHHDMARLQEVIGLGLPIVAFRELHALKVGDCLFNCSNQPLTSLCRSTPRRDL